MDILLITMTLYMDIMTVSFDDGLFALSNTLEGFSSWRIVGNVLMYNKPL